jgi:hypothetical protein
MLTTKSGVRFATITPALLHMLATVERLSRTLFGLPEEGLVITSGSDSTHMAGSKHYSGEAIDLRSKTFHPTIKQGFVVALRSALGPQFTVLLEGEGTPNEHLHLQVKKGRRFDPEALIDDANTVAIAKALRKRGKRDVATKFVRMRKCARGHRWHQRARRARREESDDGARAMDLAVG